MSSVVGKQTERCIHPSHVALTIAFVVIVNQISVFCSGLWPLLHPTQQSCEARDWEFSMVRDSTVTIGTCPLTVIGINWRRQTSNVLKNPGPYVY